MKTARVTGTAHVDATPHSPVSYLRSAAQRVFIDTAPLRLQQTLAQVEALEQALESSRLEANAAQQQVQLLATANAELRELAVRREQEIAKVRYHAYHDELTGLPNRTLMLDRLNQALARAKRQHKQLALLLLDLDGFKDINDSLGHAAGDKVLQRVAERLLSSIRGADTACRFGGDEFVLLLPEVDDEKHALAVAQKIRARLARPYRVDDYSVSVTASIGAAVYPVDGMSQNDLIKQADVSMYLAKTVKGASKVHAKIVASR